MKTRVSDIRRRKRADKIKQNYCVIYNQITFFPNKFELCIEYKTNTIIIIFIYMSTFSKFCIMYCIMYLIMYCIMYCIIITQKHNKNWSNFKTRIGKFCPKSIKSLTLT